MVLKNCQCPGTLRYRAVNECLHELKMVALVPVTLMPYFCPVPTIPSSQNEENQEAFQ